MPKKEMNNIAKRIDIIIKEGLSPLLKKEGFKKKARNFYRDHDNRIEIINIQASQGNHGNEGRFTVNAGVYFPEIAKIIDAPPVSGIPKEYDCTIRTRIGSLTPQNLDKWWNIDSLSNDSEISVSVAEQVGKLCLPWLESMSSLNTVKEFLAKNNLAFVASGIALFQNNRDEALAYLENAFKQKPLAKAKIKAWANKHGL